MRGLHRAAEVQDEGQDVCQPVVTVNQRIPVIPALSARSRLRAWVSYA
jgi:hypothetical protein